MNPSGLMADACGSADTSNRQWDGIWNARVNRSDIVDDRDQIPFRTLNFNPTVTRGVNFQRTVRGRTGNPGWAGRATRVCAG
jgi:hypothetical protein